VRPIIGGVTGGRIDSSHQLWRMLVVLLPVSCALAIFSNPAKAQTKTAERVSRCKASQLSATDDRKESDGLDGGLGHHALTIAIQNRTSSPCVLQGIPTVTFLDQANQPIAVPVCSNCSGSLFPSQPVREILVEAKGSAYLLLGFEINNGEHGEVPCRNAVAFSLRLPGQRDALRGGVAGMMYSCGTIVITPFLGRPPVGGSMFVPPKLEK
jgi:hypothetical protein